MATAVVSWQSCGSAGAFRSIARKQGGHGTRTRALTAHMAGRE